MLFGQFWPGPRRRGAAWGCPWRARERELQVGGWKLLSVTLVLPLLKCITRSLGSSSLLYDLSRRGNRMIGAKISKVPAYLEV